MSSSSNVVAKIAVVGSGISGSVCAFTLAKNGFSVSLFDSARGPGGRMSQRRETSDDGKELQFDHGAPFFNICNLDVLTLVQEWESKGLVAEWRETFGSFDIVSKRFVSVKQERASKKYVGVPGMNSICKALCNEPGVESRFGEGIARLDWIDDHKLWSLIGSNGQNLGLYNAVVASDKNIVSPRFIDVTGRPPPLDSSLASQLSANLRDLPVNPCFALMMAFAQPLSLIPLKGFEIKNSEVLRWGHCDSSKPGRSTENERWVLHSTSEYARRIIAQTGMQKPSSATLAKVAEDLFHEFQKTGFAIPRPFFMKAHRWGSAFPASSIARDDKCLWDRQKKLVACGDFCVSPSVEGAIISGLAAASKLTESLSCL